MSIILFERIFRFITYIIAQMSVHYHGTYISHDDIFRHFNGCIHIYISKQQMYFGRIIFNRQHIYTHI